MDDLNQLYLQQMLEQLVILRTDRYGTTRDAMAAAVRDSGMPSGLEGLTAVVSRAAATIDASTAEIAAALSRNNHLTERLLDATLNPLATQADELRARGFAAFGNGWFGEAATDLRRAVQTDYRDARAFLVLGLAETTLGQAEQAAEAFERAARYGATTAPEVACGAALLGSRVLDDLGRPERALALLREVARQVPSCPEVLLTLARRSRDPAALRTALSIAPELALDAAATGTAHVDAVCLDLLRELEPRGRRVQAIHAAAREAMPTEPLPALPPPPPPHRDPVLRLATLGTWVHDAVPGLDGQLSSAAVALERRTTTNRSDSTAAAAEVDAQESRLRHARAEAVRPWRFGAIAATAAGGSYLGYLLFAATDGTDGGAATLGVLAALALCGVALVHLLRALGATPAAVRAVSRGPDAQTARSAAAQRHRTLDQVHETHLRQRAALDGLVRQAKTLAGPPARTRPFTAQA